MKVPFLDLTRIHQPLKEKIIQSLSDHIDKNDFILGKSVEEFEKVFADFCGTKYALGVANGLQALELLLKAIGIKQGDEIIAPANTFNATVSAIANVGAIPVLVDTDDYFNIDVKLIEDKITNKTKAIMPVHLYGQVADMNEIMALATKHNLYVIEDACQAHGSIYNGKRAGNLGHAAAFSFYPGKNLGAFGDAGIITTNNEEIMNKVKMLRNYGQSKKYYHDILGVNSRLDTIQASILTLKLAHLGFWNSQRKRIAEIYSKELKGIVDLPLVKEGRDHIYHLFVIKLKERDKLMEYLKKNDIDSGLHYPVPIHLQKAFAYLEYQEGDFPNSENFSKDILSLPIFPGMTEEEARFVCAKIKEFYSQ